MYSFLINIFKEEINHLAFVTFLLHIIENRNIQYQIYHTYTRWYSFISIEWWICGHVLTSTQRSRSSQNWFALYGHGVVAVGGSCCTDKAHRFPVGFGRRSFLPQKSKSGPVAQSTSHIREVAASSNYQSNKRSSLLTEGLLRNRWCLNFNV